MNSKYTGTQIEAMLDTVYNKVTFSEMCEYYATSGSIDVVGKDGGNGIFPVVFANVITRRSNTNSSQFNLSVHAVCYADADVNWPSFNGMDNVEVTTWFPIDKGGTIQDISPYNGLSFIKFTVKAEEVKGNGDVLAARDQLLIDIDCIVNEPSDNMKKGIFVSSSFTASLGLA